MSDEIAQIKQRYSQLKLCKLARDFLHEIVLIMHQVASYHRRFREDIIKSDRKGYTDVAFKNLKTLHQHMRQHFHKLSLVYSAIDEENAAALHNDLKSSISFLPKQPQEPALESELEKKLRSERDELLKVRDQKNAQMHDAIKLMRLLMGDLNEPDLSPQNTQNPKL
ncbi:Oidioi.mRNA.OKI2018_I69.chr1.g3146.t1.cds [Oikopleura dioica]|uniref:Oidioi.mRNA.OKI2018_I69.chr1.g3146.t1.cds n=1 Tax=Oikopleura dioica TaxID=34765 RepID=A0ABN7SX56_OIKDI|nr:Oidioi.mRNA.OKI2018_I69.chr1.g3146.t1.cds [Oikopleura dioica]